MSWPSFKGFPFCTKTLSHGPSVIVAKKSPLFCFSKWCECDGCSAHSCLPQILSKSAVVSEKSGGQARGQCVVAGSGSRQMLSAAPQGPGSGGDAWRGVFTTGCCAYSAPPSVPEDLINRSPCWPQTGPAEGQLPFL